MTFLELCKRTRRECGIQGSGPAAVTSQSGLLLRIVEWVQEADMYIQRLHSDWEFLWSEFTDDTTLGSADISKPSDLGVWNIESFAVDKGTDDGRNLPWMPLSEWSEYLSSKSNDEPTRICVMPSGNLKLEYPADGVYEIYAQYWKKATKLTTSGQSPLYDQEYQRAIVEKAKMFYFADQEMVNLYQVAEKDFNEVIQRMKDRYLPEKLKGLHSPPQLVVRPE